MERLAGCGVRRMIVTDSLIIPETQAFPLEVVSVGSLLADAIGCLHRGQSLARFIRHE
jgi:phosphoribosylpyrophosphate synthetase